MTPMSSCCDRNPLRLGALFILGLACFGQTPTIDSSNWGAVVSPVYGTRDPRFGGAAELLAGPNQFGGYYTGVLPNGKLVKPVGVSTQVGMTPLGMALTADGKFIVTSNDNEREQGTATLLDTGNAGGYSLTVVDTETMKVVSRTATGRYFIGLQVTGTGPYTIWASAGPDQQIRMFTLSTVGAIANASPATLTIAPIQSRTEGYVNAYTPAPSMNATNAAGDRVPVPTSFARTGTTSITFPAGSAVSPDGKYLYVACNGDNSVAVIDTAAKRVVRQLPAGYFPYGVAVSAKGDQVMVSNWGVTEYKFANPTYDSSGRLSDLKANLNHVAWGYFVPFTNTAGSNPRSSSISLYTAPGGDGAALRADGALYQGRPLDELYQVGDTHPSALAIVKRGDVEVLYVAKSNSDALGRIVLGQNRVLADFDLAPISLKASDGHPVHGAYPNALAVSPDQTRLYVAEAGLNSVAVLDTSDPLEPKLLGRIPTGWFPSSLAVSPDGQSLYIANAKGVGEDINPKARTDDPAVPTSGVQAIEEADSNFVFGTVQKVDLSTHKLDSDTVLKNNYTFQMPADTSVVPVGGGPSKKIKHVIFILKENKTFDSMLGSLKDHFGVFAGTTFPDRAGKPEVDLQYTGVALNTQLLARTFATGVNYYSDSEESDAGHQYASSGTNSDYAEKTLRVKSGRGLLVNKAFEPEDYPESGYIFNNAARNGVDFKVYGDMSRLAGTDTGTSTPTRLNDPASGNAGYPSLNPERTGVTRPAINAGDVTSPTEGLGQSYFLTLPGLSVLGKSNRNGESRVDYDYPGYNFNISDQRRARRFIEDFDRMVAIGTVPQFLYIYLPNDHTGSVQAPNSRAVLHTEAGTNPMQQVADGDIALGMVVRHILQSPIYYNAETGEGSAIFVTWDDAQSCLDHLHPHRTPLLVISPYAKPGYLATRHYSTASVVKTEELLMGLPPNNLGDLFATDLRDMFQSTYNGITAEKLGNTFNIAYEATPEGKRIWSLAGKLEMDGPDRDSRRLGALARLSIRADGLHKAAAAEKGGLRKRTYKTAQKKLYEAALEVLTEEDE
jgi:YVTN family beta-propeller protein